MFSTQSLFLSYIGETDNLKFKALHDLSPSNVFTLFSTILHSSVQVNDL